MDVYIQMFVWQKDKDSGRLPDFSPLGFYPGAIQKTVKKGSFWLDSMDEKSVLPIAILMQRAYQMNKMVVFKKPDNLTQKLLHAYRNRIRLQAMMAVAIRTKESGNIWQGSYEFSCHIGQMLANQRDGDGNQWETIQLNIIDQTETMPALE